MFRLDSSSLRSCSLLVGTAKVGVDGVDQTMASYAMELILSKFSMVPCRGGLQARQWKCCCWYAESGWLDRAELKSVYVVAPRTDAGVLGK